MTTEIPDYSDRKPCTFCGSHACEWDGNLLLGCEDCGYEVGDPIDDPVPYEIAARSMFGPPEPMTVDEMEMLHRTASIGNPDLYRDIRRGK